MKRLSLAIFAATLALAGASPANAAYSIVQWGYGDCKIWEPYGPLAQPDGAGWTILAADLATYETAYAALQHFYRTGVCK